MTNPMQPKTQRQERRPLDHDKNEGKTIWGKTIQGLNQKMILPLIVLPSQKRCQNELSLCIHYLFSFQEHIKCLTAG